MSATSDILTDVLTGVLKGEVNHQIDRLSGHREQSNPGFNFQYSVPLGGSDPYSLSNSNPFSNPQDFLGQAQNLVGQATTAYCATQKPELYYTAFGLGFFAAIPVILIIMLVASHIGGGSRRYDRGRR